MQSLLASKSAQGDGKFAANAVTPLQYASAGDSPPTTLLYFSTDDCTTHTFEGSHMSRTVRTAMSAVARKIICMAENV